MAALAAALAAWQRGEATEIAVGTAWATATKPFWAVLAPFVVDRFGWRSGLVGLGTWAACYVPWWWDGSAAEWAALRVMGTGFEYNSTGYAVLALGMSPGVARGVAAGLVILMAAWMGGRWLRGDRTELPPIGGFWRWRLPSRPCSTHGIP
ncbi:MAG: hypothetical protein J6386_02270 [Candidatus Synoicihabitans palmerolidicus]|nr:hypothetical protein [Candidatus Synoicihabitans palmerolidicus]